MVVRKGSQLTRILADQGRPRTSPARVRNRSNCITRTRWTHEESLALRDLMINYNQKAVSALPQCSPLHRWESIQEDMVRLGFPRRTVNGYKQHWNSVRRDAHAALYSDDATPRPVHCCKWSLWALSVLVAITSIFFAANEKLMSRVWQQPLLQGLPPGVSAPPPISLTRSPSYGRPDMTHLDDDEILCDCAWTEVPKQSCQKTRGKPGFPCWHECCMPTGKNGIKLEQKRA